MGTGWYIYAKERLRNKATVEVHTSSYIISNRELRWVLGAELRIPKDRQNFIIQELIVMGHLRWLDQKNFLVVG